MTGTLHLVGVGPGDPELLTLKAARIVAAADIVAHAQTGDNSAMALDIARAHVSPAATLLPVPIPMLTAREQAQSAYDTAAGIIATHLAAGRNVAWLCEGDPLFYGSAMYLLARLAGSARIEIVPGVTSLTAAAAAIARPLAARNETLKVLPAPLPDDTLRAELATAPSAAIIKVGRHFDRIRALLAETGHARNAMVIEHATTPRQRVTALETFAHGERPYFSTILCYRGAEAWGMKPAIVAFAPASAALAQRLATLLDAEIIDATASKHAIPRLFTAGRPIVGLCAAGILIRLLAPHLSDKHAEPPVLAVSQDGAHVVPLLGGHHGANRLARQIADALGGTAALTTASDSRFARGLDDPPPGWVVADPAAAKPAMLALLAGSAIALDGHAPWLAAAGYPIAAAGAVKVRVGDSLERRDGELLYHPKTLVVGLGAERGVDAAEVIDLITATLATQNLAPASIAALATIDLKSDELAFHAAARHFNVPLRLFTATELNEERDRLPNPSALVEAEVGTPGVAEAAALKAGTLIVPKCKSARATSAIGRAAEPIDPATLGRAPGVLHVVGVGPGDRASRTASAVAALDAASDWVGYGLYLDLVADVRLRQAEHRFPLGDEEARTRHALELAGQGKTVALICSGDAQIYAMAALVYELLDATGPRALSPAARRAAIEIHPGISAVQAASAAAGALIGHDFCCISLSDLLTPAADIRRRLAAAAEADFVTALYNPRSARRTDLIVEARAAFLAHRPPETPVLVASSLGRPLQQVTVTTLAAFDPASIDMLTIVLIGASTSRTLTRGDGRTLAYTPRGYETEGAAVTVYFIGAGPGAPDLITVRGQKLIERCPVCLYAGSLVPAEIVAAAPPGALVRDTAPMHLDEILALMADAHARNADVARVHSGDPSIYGAIAEQMRRLGALAIPYEVVPGVPAFAAAAARLATELTLPEISQTIILTRTSGKASPMPPRETLEILGQSGATLAIHLSIRNLAYVEAALTPHYGADCPAIVVYRATWPDEVIIVTTLAEMRSQVREEKITRTALIFVGRVFGETQFHDSRLYAPDFAHVLRNAGKKKLRAGQ